MVTVKGSRRANEYSDLRPLFDRLSDPRLPPGDRASARERLIVGHLPVAAHIAWRFQNRGQSVEDLNQVAAVGLVQAVDRFDPSRGTDFIAFAVPTITGELRRHFRDKGWAVRVPRRLQELDRSVRVHAERLAVELNRSPRPSEIATAMGLPVEDVYEALQAGEAYSASSLDTEAAEGSVDPHVIEVDHELELVADRAALQAALALLPAREALIIKLRFVGDLTQSQIAQRVGLSQMHVSRLLTASLRALRGIISADGLADTA